MAVEGIYTKKKQPNCRLLAFPRPGTLHKIVYTPLAEAMGGSLLSSIIFKDKAS